MKLTGTDRQAEGQVDGQDHVLSQADALTKNKIKNPQQLKCFIKDFFVN